MNLSSIAEKLCPILEKNISQIQEFVKNVDNANYNANSPAQRKRLVSFLKNDIEFKQTLLDTLTISEVIDKSINKSTPEITKPLPTRSSGPVSVPRFEEVKEEVKEVEIDEKDLKSLDDITVETRDGGYKTVK